MAYQDDRRPMGPRQMVDVTNLGITCAQCGTPIDKLPFEPTKKEDGTYGRLFCYECNKARRAERGPRREYSR